MIDRFLSYSLRWACPIKLVYLQDGQMKTGNITVGHRQSTTMALDDLADVGMFVHRT